MHYYIRVIISTQPTTTPRILRLTDSTQGNLHSFGVSTAFSTTSLHHVDSLAHPKTEHHVEEQKVKFGPPEDPYSAASFKPPINEFGDGLERGKCFLK